MSSDAPLSCSNHENVLEALKKEKSTSRGLKIISNCHCKQYTGRNQLPGLEKTTLQVRAGEDATRVLARAAPVQSLRFTRSLDTSHHNQSGISEWDLGQRERTTGF